MSDLIKRKDAIKILACEMYAEAQLQGYEVDSIDDFMPEAKAWMNDAPTIDSVSVVHGEWICHKGKWIDFDYYPTKYECSQCHHYVDVASDKNFCPNCGARMKGADDE